MSTFLVRHATILVAMDDHRREIPDGGLFIRDGFIEQVGASAALPSSADEILDLNGYILLPGLPIPFIPDNDALLSDTLVIFTKGWPKAFEASSTMRSIFF